jgi:hypothetical protein
LTRGALQQAAGACQCGTIVALRPAPEAVMGNKPKSFAAIVAFASALLFFGAALSNAHAGHGPYVPHPRHHRSFYRYPRPYSGRACFHRPYRPYRLVRVHVYDPYPRWTYRRVYYAPPAVRNHCRPY